MKKQEATFQKALCKSHNKFYIKIMHSKRLQLQEDVDQTSKQLDMDRKLLTKNEHRLQQRKISQKLNELDTGLSKQTKLAVRNSTTSKKVNKKKASIVDISIMEQQIVDRNKRTEERKLCEIEQNKACLHEFQEMFSEQEVIDIERQRIYDEEHQTRKEVIQLFSKEGQDQISFVQYVKYMKDKEIRKQVIQQLLDSTLVPKLSLSEQDELQIQLQEADKRLFFALINKSITYEQLKARISEKKERAHYLCLDDLIQGGLHPSIYENLNEMEELIKLITKKKSLSEVSLEDLNKLDQPWQSNPHCLKSVLQMGKKQQRVQIQEDFKQKVVQSAQQSPRNQEIVKELTQMKQRLVKNQSCLKVGKSQKSQQNIYLDKIKQTLNTFESKEFEMKKKQYGVRSNESSFLRVQNFCAPFDLKRIDKFIEWQQNKQNLSQSFENRNISLTNKVNELKRGSNSLYVKKDKKSKENKDMLFLRILKNDGQNVMVNQKDEYILNQIKEEIDLRRNIKLMIKPKKPRPRDLFLNQSNEKVNEIKPLQELIETTDQVPQIIESEQLDEEMKDYYVDYEQPKVVEQNTVDNNQMLIDSFQASQQIRPFSGVQQIKIDKHKKSLFYNIHKENNTETQQQTFINNAASVKSTNLDQSFLVNRNVRSQQHSRRNSLYLKQQQHCQQKGELQNSGQMKLKSRDSGSVSGNFLQFLSTLGIPVDVKSQDSQLKPNQLRILSAQQRTRPVSGEQSYLYSPSMFSDAGFSSSVGAQKVDYKSNAIAYRIAKKEVDKQNIGRYKNVLQVPNILSPL